MGLFTGLALAGALMAGKKLGERGKGKTPDAPITAPGPADATKAGTPPIAPPIVSPGADQAAAANAGTKQRKKAALGSLAPRTLPKAGAIAQPARPKSLIGY